MEKKPWNYSGKSQKGFQLSGTVFALSLKDAQTQVKNMGINDAIVVDPMGETINQPAADAVVPNSPAMGIAPSAAGFVIPPTPSSFGSKVNQEQNLKEMIGGLNKTVQDQLKSTIVPARRQSLFIGKQAEVLGFVEPLLAKQNGHIINVQMRPGHDGFMMYAIVVEHDSKE